MRKLTLILGLVFCSHIFAEVKLIDVHQLKQRIENPDEVLILLDVRTAGEYQSGHIKDSINIPHDQLLQSIDILNQYRNQPIAVFCKSGRRAQLVINTLADNEFEQLVDIEGDMLAWKTSGFPVVR